MEPSFLASWQFENFSTAELSPPVSPVSPSSPLFYDGSNPSSPSSGSVKGGIQHVARSGSKVALQQQSQKPAMSSVLTSRALAATNMLNELERLHSVEHQNAFGIGLNEESVDLNMDLFEELQDIEFTPPPLFSSSEDNGPRQFEVPNVPISSQHPVVPPSIDNSKFSTEFKSILESLTTANKININSGNTTTISPINNSIQLNNFGSLFESAGIPTTTVVGNECLVPLEVFGRPSATGSIGKEEVESMDLDGIIISNDIQLINENELFSLGELSAELAIEENSNGSIVNSNATLVNGVLPYWAKDMAIPIDELDNEMSRNVDVLDALLKGDVSTAKNVITPGYSSPVSVKQPFSPISTYASDDDDSIIYEEIIETAEVVQPEPVVEAKKKAERRGRKPAKSGKNSIHYIKDKSLRKKEQNKTAATRYRQKKKQELAVTLSEEEELQLVHDDLDKQKGKLGSEISVIRSLLRDLLAARKKRVSPASSSLTASSLVQAQRIAKNRKY